MRQAKPSGQLGALTEQGSVTARVDGVMAGAGLTLGQFGVLEALLHHGPLCQRELGAKLLRSDGKPVPADNTPSALLLPMGRDGPAFLAYPNFINVYLDWNNSLIYSTTAGYYATRLGGAPPLRRASCRMSEASAVVSRNSRVSAPTAKAPASVPRSEPARLAVAVKR